MRQFTRQQKMLLASGGGALLIILAMIGVLVTREEPKEEVRTARTVQTIPDAEENESPESKRDAYRSGARSMDSYWDSLEEDSDRMNEGEAQVTGSPRSASALTYDDITSGTDVRRETTAPTGRTIRDDPQRQALLRAIEETEKRQREAAAEAQPAQEEEPEPERIQTMQVQVKRTGAISSLDEDIPEDLGTGFSSLDDQQFVTTDAGHPYRCMFSRDEKVKSGQRVSVRLLEDMVVGGTLVPKNTRLSAVCTIGKRMELVISTIEINNRIHAVTFEGYDTDGTKGIYCSDLVESTRKLKSQGLSSAGSIISGRSMVGLARDAANVGLAIAQSAGGETTVSIPSGYVFYLVEKKGNER